MFAAGYGTVSDIEILFATIALVGFVFSVLTSIQAWGDYNFLKENSIKNGKWTIAKATIITELGRAYLQGMFLFLAVVSFMRPDPDITYLSTLDYVIASVARWLFITGALVVMLKSIYVWYSRQRLLEDVDVQERRS